MNPLAKIIAAGFSFEFSDGELLVTPFSKLTDTQKTYLKARKADIIEALTVTRWYQFKATKDNATTLHTVVGWTYPEIAAAYPDAVIVPLVTWQEAIDVELVEVAA